MIESIVDFKKNLEEIDILASYSRINRKSIEKYKLFNKTAIVLLCSHFETFVEAFISEHVDALRACYNSGNIPQNMKDNYINDTIKSLKGLAEPSKHKKSLDALNALFKLHDSVHVEMSNLNNLELDMRYSFGHHGQDETERLFKKFGFKAFVESEDFKEPFQKINSAISIRNNIIHEGSAPTLSYEDLKNYKNAFLQFADGLQKHIITNQELYYGMVFY